MNAVFPLWFLHLIKTLKPGALDLLNRGSEEKINKMSAILMLGGKGP